MARACSTAPRCARTARWSSRAALIQDIVAVAQRPRGGAQCDLGGGVLAPGFVDWQVNGGGGVLFNATPTPEAIGAIASAHRREGTTAILPTVISDAPEVLAAALAAAREALTSAPGAFGVHVEGPYIDARRKGVHSAEFIRAMREKDAAQLIAAKAGAMVVTVAPAAVGVDLIARLAAAGLVVSLGHAEATAEEAKAAFAAGASAVTHLFNAMTQLSSRAPGVVGAALADPRVICGLIADGHHVHETAMRVAFNAKGADGIALVSDAMPPACGGPSAFMLQGRRVAHTGGRLVDEDGALAGAAITMLGAVRVVVETLGAPLADALAWRRRLRRACCASMIASGAWRRGCAPTSCISPTTSASPASGSAAAEKARPSGEIALRARSRSAIRAPSPRRESARASCCFTRLSQISPTKGAKEAHRWRERLASPGLGVFATIHRPDAVNSRRRRAGGRNRRLDGAGWNAALIVALVVFGVLALLGVYDLAQTRHAVLRNYPISAHLRFLLEHIRPEMRQYFFESETDGLPFSRNQRAIVYQRAKMALDKRPFGTQLDVYAQGYEWLRHSIAPKQVASEPFRITVGGPDCTQPYSTSVFNISAMSFGALSANAIRALNKGAALGGFAHDTGEGGYSPYHREGGGDVIWEIGSGYFGCRTPDGGFDADNSPPPPPTTQIKMIEIKLSQGAKPGHGGVLPGAKVTAEIAAIRGVEAGKDCISPARHGAFSTPLEMMDFIARAARAVAAASRSASSSASAIPGSSWRSARRCWRRASIPISSSSTARRAAPARRRWNSPTTSARRCARASSSCATR